MLHIELFETTVCVGPYISKVEVSLFPRTSSEFEEKEYWKEPMIDGL